MKDNRLHLMVVHCVSHRLELSVKDAFKLHESFKKIDDTLLAIWNLFRHSGKLKRLLKMAGEQLGIQVVAWKKSSGTRFQNHKVTYCFCIFNKIL